jgi:hypothetical protein
MIDAYLCIKARSESEREKCEKGDESNVEMHYWKVVSEYWSGIISL